MRTRLLASLAVALFLVSASSALADTASLSITDAAGNADPAAGIGRTFTVTGNTPTAKYLWVKFRATGGAACAPSPGSDAGADLNQGASGIYGYFEYDGPYNGNFTDTAVGTWTQGSGTFLFCIWLTTSSNSNTPATPISQVITFRNSTGTISASVGPISPSPRQSATVTLTGASETTANAYAKIRPAGGAPCAASYDADPGEPVVRGTSVNGNYSVTGTFSEDTAGSYLLCSWLADSSSDPSPIAGPQPLTVVVGAPPPPPAPACVVPRIAAGTSIANASAILAAAHCSLGKRRYVASSRVARGAVVKVSTAVGTSLAPQARVDLLLSSGAPCVIPVATRRMRLSTARIRLNAAGCTPGAVRYVRSHRPRKTVVRFSSRTGSRLAPRATVTIMLAR